MTQLHWCNYADLVRDTMKLAPALAGCSMIMGVARSGMLPATILATALHKPLAMIDIEDYEDGETVELSVRGFRGRRLCGADDVGGPKNNGPIVIVDDSVLTGATLAALTPPDHGHHERRSKYFQTACVYCHPQSTGKVDHYAVALPSPRVFEWNLFGSELSKHSILDIDGVLCPDPPMPEDDWGGYIDYLASAPVLHRPLFKVAGLVTNRIEKTREVTEKWLADNDIEYGTLTMAPFESAKARRRMSTPADLKSAWYADFTEQYPTPGILIESHDHIAAQVAQNVGRPVVSLQSMRCFD